MSSTYAHRLADLKHLEQQVDLEHDVTTDTDGWRAARLDARRTQLLDALGAGDLDPRETRLLDWLAGQDSQTVAGVAALLDRARG